MIAATTARQSDTPGRNNAFECVRRTTRRAVVTVAAGQRSSVGSSSAGSVGPSPTASDTGGEAFSSPPVSPSSAWIRSVRRPR